MIKTTNTTTPLPLQLLLLITSTVVVVSAFSVVSISSRTAFLSKSLSPTLPLSLPLRRQAWTFSFSSSSSSLLHAAAASSAPSSSSKLTRLPQSAVQVDIIAPGPSTQAAYDKVCRELSKQITIPGFRKGAKIPPQVLEQAMAAKGGRSALRKEAINSLLTQLIEPTLKQEYNLEPIGQPTLLVSVDELVDIFVPGQELQLQVKCDVWPDLQWKRDLVTEKPYLGLTGRYTRKPFNQAKLETTLQDLKERYAILDAKEQDDSSGVLELGDACTVQMDGYWALADGSKGEPLPNAASGENVLVILGPGRYMEGLVEGLLGAKVGDTKTISVQFPKNLRDKTLAGKAAVFDVKVLEAFRRTLPDVTDDFAAQIRPGMTAETLLAELRKAIDDDDAGKEITPARNAALSKALAELVEVEIPETLITNQARDKFAIMMTEMRDNGTPDDVIKKSITPENFEKYKKIVRDDIIRDFRVSMAVDEIARVENIQVPDYQVDEQLEIIKKDAQDSKEEFDEASIRRKVENTLQRQLVFDFLAEHAQLQVDYQDEQKFDEDLLNKLAEETLQREREAAAAVATTNTEGKIIDAVQVNEDEEARITAAAAAAAESEGRAKAEAAAEEAQAKAAAAAEKAQAKAAADAAAAQAKAAAAAEKAQAKAAAAAEEAQAKAAAAAEEAQAKAAAAAAEEAQAKAAAAAAEKARVKAEEEARAKAKAEAEARAKAEEEARLKAAAEEEEARLEAEKQALLNPRLQPKAPEQEAQIAARYESLSVQERAFQILLDTGAISKSQDPDDPDYDNSNDDEICSDIRYV